MQKVIWSLFDSETDIVKNVIRSENLKDYRVFSFGVGSARSACTHIAVDLAEPVFLPPILFEYPEPDIVFAFPPCQTWINVSCGNCPAVHRQKGFNLYWKDKFTPFRSPQRIVEKRLNGSLCALTTVKIIERFKPGFWFVENPSRSSLFDFLSTKLDFQGFKNLTDYLSYGYDYHKPTTIYSNVKIPLKKTPRVHSERNVFDLPVNDRNFFPEKMVLHILECLRLNIYESVRNDECNQSLNDNSLVDYI